MTISMFRRFFRVHLFFCAGLGLFACVSFPDAPAPAVSPAIEAGALRASDGARLPLAVHAAEDPRAVIIALHGMNDYSRAFAGAAQWWAENAQITTYAYDQRGFGRSASPGHWPGAKTLVADLRAGLAAAREAHPGLPVFVLGHSMGAAVVMRAEAEASLGADGLILAAPGVWGGGALPLHYRAVLNVAANIAPGATLTGERAGRQSTDNMEILREMSADPLVIKETRLDAVLGVVQLMGSAFARADEIDADILYLMGVKDEIIPVKKMSKTALS
jgi:alpha-beta hydrolase superfamily lysophospholipase